MKSDWQNSFNNHVLDTNNNNNKNSNNDDNDDDDDNNFMFLLDAELSFGFGVYGRMLQLHTKRNSS